MKQIEFCEGELEPDAQVRELEHNRRMAKLRDVVRSWPRNKAQELVKQGNSLKERLAVEAQDEVDREIAHKHAQADLI